MTDQNEQTLYQKLESEIVNATWGLLKEHHEKGIVIWVTPELDLVQAGVDIAEDNVNVVREHMTSLKLGQPTVNQVEKWEADEDLEFSMIVVQPYVLIQEKLEEQ